VNPVCGGYCPAANLSETKSIYTPHDTYCRVTNMFYDSAERFYHVMQNEACFEELLRSAKAVSGAGEK